MRGVGRLAPGQDGAGGDPAGAAAHHFDDAASAVVGGHAADVHGDFHDGAGVVFGDGAETGAMVGVGQIVINGFGHADDAHVVAALDGFEMDFVGGVLGVVAAGVKEEADVVGLEYLEKAVHFLGGLGGFLFEVNFIAAGAQGGAGGVFEGLDGGGRFRDGRSINSSLRMPRMPLSPP